MINGTATEKYELGNCRYSWLLGVRIFVLFYIVEKLNGFDSTGYSDFSNTTVLNMYKNIQKNTISFT